MDQILLSVFLEACMFVTCVSESLANQWTVSVGDNTSFPCKPSPGYSVFVVTFQKGTNKIGTFDNNTSTIDEGFKGRCSIRKEHSVFKLYITKVEASDQGQYKCKIIYENKHDETFEDHLKVQANQRTVCVGDNTSFACKPNPGYSVFVVTFQKGTQKFGTYFNTPFIDEGLKGRYSIRKEHSVFKLYITKVEASDQGQFRCKIIYENKHDETFEYYLKVQETQMSTEVHFRKENQGMCMILTCGDNSRKVKLKGPNEKNVKKDKQIKLNSCKGTLMSGTYTCCVDAKCIKDCKSETLTGGVVSDATLVSIKPQLLVTMSTVIAALWIHAL